MMFKRQFVWLASMGALIAVGDALTRQEKRSWQVGTV